MKIAIEGCAHGELDKIYETLKLIEERENIKVDLLLCCGDFQATRNIQDLNAMAVPVKYKRMCSFHKYYSGEKIAPVLTIFIGGNHEASNYLQELPYGGWAAPNIFYLGTAGVVEVGGLRVAGISGIFKSRDYSKGRYESHPYTEETKRSVYHLRNLDVFRLKQIKSGIDIMLSHDWPRGIYHYGNKSQLLKNKPYFENDIKEDKLGCGPLEEILSSVQPCYWFAAHLHCKFSAIFPHVKEKGQIKKYTKFLALDKCLPRRKFLQVLDVPSSLNDPIEIKYDLEWLSILFNTDHLSSVKRTDNYLPSPSGTERWNFMPKSDEKEFILLKMNGDLKVPLNFERTASSYMGSPGPIKLSSAPLLNPQTENFCLKLGVRDPLGVLLKSEGRSWEAEVNKGEILNSDTGAQERRSASLSINSRTSLSSSSFIQDTDDSTVNTIDDPGTPTTRYLDNSLKDFTPSPKFHGSLESVLPPPKYLASDDEKYIDLNVESSIDNSKEWIVIDTERIPINASNQGAKRFKRRNYEVYKNKEGDDEKEEGAG